MNASIHPTDVKNSARPQGHRTIAAASPLIITRILGGLGNQLFQYAYGLYLSQALGGRLRLDVSGFSNYELHAYGLNELNIPLETASATDLRPLTLLGDSRYGRALAKRLMNVTGRRRFMREGDYTLSADSLKNLKWIYLDGYWQKHAYLNGQRPRLLKEFTPRQPVPQLYVENGAKPTVGVHIRRGDYVSIGCVISFEYYLQAFKIMREKVGRDVTPVIFSDDPAWARENLKLSPGQVIREKGSTITDFVHFSQCDHQIIANSTFSWWGAWLNTNPGKTVIVPNRWMRDDQFDLSELMPPEWISVGSGN